MKRPLLKASIAGGSQTLVAEYNDEEFATKLVYKDKHIAKVEYDREIAALDGEDAAYISPYVDVTENMLKKAYEKLSTAQLYIKFAQYVNAKIWAAALDDALGSEAEPIVKLREIAYVAEYPHKFIKKADIMIIADNPAQYVKQLETLNAKEIYMLDVKTLAAYADEATACAYAAMQKDEQDKLLDVFRNLYNSTALHECAAKRLISEAFKAIPWP